MGPPIERWCQVSVEMGPPIEQRCQVSNPLIKRNPPKFINFRPAEVFYGVACVYLLLRGPVSPPRCSLVVCARRWRVLSCEPWCNARQKCHWNDMDVSGCRKGFSRWKWRIKKDKNSHLTKKHPCDLVFITHGVWLKQLGENCPTNSWCTMDLPNMNLGHYVSEC